MFHLFIQICGGFTMCTMAFIGTDANNAEEYARTLLCHTLYSKLCLALLLSTNFGAAVLIIYAYSARYSQTTASRSYPYSLV